MKHRRITAEHAIAGRRGALFGKPVALMMHVIRVRRAFLPEAFSERLHRRTILWR